MESSVEAEEWRSVVGYEGLYEVSNIGRVRALMRNGVKLEKPFIRKLQLLPDGYLHVRLVKTGVKEKTKTVLVSRLVAMAFLPNPDSLPQVNHKDENKTNNRLYNLEWCTCKYNTNYGTCISRRAEKQINHPLKSRPVNQYALDGTLLATYPSFMEAHRVTGINRSLIQMCCTGGRVKSKGTGADRRRVFERTLTAGGFKWQYADINNKKQENKQ